MGVGPFRRKSSCSCEPANNPNPKNYKILTILEQKPYLLVKVEYPDATNLEGIKVLLMRETIEHLSNRQELDPHFTRDKAIIARFHPEMWTTAVEYLKHISLTSKL